MTTKTYLKKTGIFLSAAILGFLLSVSCSVHEAERPLSRESGEFSSMRAYLPDRICVYDPSELFKGAAVKSGGGDGAVFIDEDDLDYANARFYEADSMKYIQIPVRNVGLPDSNVIRFVKIETTSKFSPPGGFKTFLVYRTRLDGSMPAASIIMIAYQPKYMTDEEISSLDCFNCEGLNGVLFYADLDGSIYLVEMVINGDTAGYYDILTPEEAEEYEGEVHVLIFPDVSPSSDDGDGSTDNPYKLDPAVMIGELPDDPDIPEPPDHGGRDLPGEGDDHLNPYIDHTIGGGRGGGGGGHGEPDPGEDDDYVSVELVIEKVGRGETTGEGIYQMGFQITCTATPEYIGGEQTSEFIGWSGAYQSTAPRITFSLTEAGTHVLTATFHDYAPCNDPAQGRADPLLEMEILGTINNGIKGGDYGNGRGRFHNGIDLACPIGTPVYSTMDGEVSRIKNVPHGRFGDVGGNMDPRDFATGNAIYITTTVNGKEYTSVYWHLDEIYVTLGQKVSIGTIIGTSGMTGNAAEKGCAGPHLHYGLKEGGAWSSDYLNPKTHLYAVFGKDGKNDNDCRKKNVKK
ncbi:MAG: M23 family metallopeptidase [Bacteroidetes bacterium]|uniref:M23 family metallopeptidase n=1 Tax=Candidatus Merdivivens pullistercoris TaxID=2840873 RepID=A0A9D9N942_9BACT|nr:M23 family metallopeptidase [Candidatus Merdivivens pullistercoris]